MDNMDTEEPAEDGQLVLPTPFGILTNNVNILDFDQKQLFCNGLMQLVGLPPKTIPNTDHVNKLYELGVELVRLKKLCEAFVCFNEILKIRFYYLHAYQYLNTVRGRLVRQSHIRMLNDTHRVAVFEQAIQHAIESSRLARDYRFLDLGTGTGLLALHAVAAGCRSIVACQESPLMYSIVRQTFLNKRIGDHVRLVNRYSMELQSKDIGGPFDLIVTDTFDSSGFGEGILQNMIHAKTHLLKDDGRILPHRIVFYIAGFYSPTMANETVCTNQELEDLIYLKNYRLVANTPGSSYSTVNTRLIKDFKIITNVQEAFTCDFNDVAQMRAILDGSQINKVLLSYKRPLFLDGFVMWFDLDVDSTNTHGSAPTAPSCWDQMIFKLKHRFANTQKLHYLNLTISCPGGVWNVQHFYDYTGRVLAVDQNVIRFINDNNYLHTLETEFFCNGQMSAGKSSPNSRTTYSNVLDFSPFPYIGISLLKEGRATRLYCSTAVEQLVRFVATHNCLSHDQIVFIDDPADVRLVADMFDVIILDLIDSHGCLNSDHVSNYESLKDAKLNKGGRMIPNKVEVWARAIRSECLAQDNYLSNLHLQDSSVIDIINDLSVDHKTNLGVFEYTRLSDPFLCGELRLNGGYGNNLLLVPVFNCIDKLNGILYWYNISFTANTSAISTIAPSSYIRRACFITGSHKTIIIDECARLRFIQYKGLIRITNNLSHNINE